MSYNKESIMLQIAEVEANIRRLRTLVECDMLTLDINVGLYCCLKASMQLQNIAEEINPVKSINKP